MCKRPRSSICISLADKQQCILIPGENTPQACYWSQQSCPSKKPTPCSFPLGREYSLLRARSIFCFVRQLVLVQIVFWAAKHGSFSLLVFLCVLYSLFIKLDCQLPQDSIGGFVFCSASSNRSSFPQKLKVASRKQEFFDDQSKYLSCITSLGDNNFADKTTPVLGSKNGPQNGVHSFSLNLICLSGRLGPRFGGQKRTPKRGSFCRQIF